jgi:hypothetical protein
MKVVGNEFNFYHFQFSIDFLDRLESSFRIQHGLALMIWETFLHSTFERLINLLESGAKRNQPGSIEQSSYSDRRHKASKDRLFRRDMFGSGADLVLASNNRAIF